MSNLWGGGVVKARKLYPCIWCSGNIQIGEPHWKAGGKWEGDWQDWRMHSDCLDAHQRETSDGEIHTDAHQRARTCEETESVRRKFLADLATQLAQDRAAGMDDARLAKMALDMVEEFQGNERHRVHLLEQAAVKGRKETQGLKAVGG